MFSSTAIDLNALPPLILLYMPPLLRAKAKAIAAQEPLVHPIWRKFEERGNHFVARTNDLKDIEDNISKANEELSKLNYNSEIEGKAKQMVLDRLNQ